jgi:hypothetical protein
MYCTLDGDNNAACCAVGFNCAGEGSSTTSLASATSVKGGSTATRAASLSSVGMFVLTPRPLRSWTSLFSRRQVRECGMAKLRY